MLNGFSASRRCLSCSVHNPPLINHLLPRLNTWEPAEHKDTDSTCWFMTRGGLNRADVSVNTSPETFTDQFLLRSLNMSHVHRKIWQFYQHSYKRHVYVTCCCSYRASVHLLKITLDKIICLINLLMNLFHIFLFWCPGFWNKDGWSKENIKHKVCRHCDDHCDEET